MRCKRVRRNLPPTVDITGLREGMVLAADLVAETGLKLADKGTELSGNLVTVLNNYSAQGIFKGPVKVLVRKN